MASVKRRNGNQTTGATRNKKPKTEQKKLPKILSEYRETETDSDPIVESDTTEHSGDDDGASWPSGDEVTGDQALPAAEKSSEDCDEDDDGGVELPKESHFQKQKNARTVAKDSISSREAHAKQKATMQERKASKPNADTIARAKKLWERLRRQSHVPLKERKELAAELFGIINGHIKEFVLKHDASRVVQTGIKYGNLAQRKSIARELKGEFYQLAQSKFAKHMIGKLLVHGDDEIRDLVIPEFYGKVRKMIKHPEAAWILDDVYRGAATKEQKSILLREWYGAEYALFKQGQQGDTMGDLSKILENNPEKRGPIMRYLFDMINQLIQKRTTGFTMLHDAMLQYYLNVAPGTDAATEFLEIIKGDEEGDLLKNLAFTKSGSRLVSLLFAHSAAKERKLLLRAFKGAMDSMAGDVHAHKVLLVALDVIDDTVLTTKSIYSELLPKATEPSKPNINGVIEYIFHQYARVPILYPFAHKAATILPTETNNLLNEIHKIRSNTSKKDPETRRRELAKFIAPQLLDAITARTADLFRSTFGCVAISEVLLACSDTVIQPNDRMPTLQAIINTIKDTTMGSTILTPPVGRMLKSLVLSGHFDPKLKSVKMCEPPLGFADILYDALGKEIVQLARGENSFVVLGMLETGDFSKQRSLVELLKEGEDGLRKAAEVGNGNKGTRLILQKLQG